VPTIIDSFIMQMGWDPSDFTRGSKQIRGDLKGTRDAADSAAKAMESSFKRGANSLASLKNEVIGIGLAFAGASTMKAFVSGILDNDAAVGRLSANIGVAIPRIGAWQGVVKQAGGTAQDAATALSAMSTAIAQYQLTRSTGSDAAYRALGVNLEDMQAGPEAMLMKIAQASEHMNRRNFVSLAQMVGLPPSVISSLEVGTSALRVQLAVQERHAAITNVDARAAQDLQAKLADLSTLIQGKARPVVSDLAQTALGLANNADASNKAINEATPLLGLLAVAAGVAGAPFIALAAAIGLVAINYGKLKSEWKDFDSWWESVKKSTDSPQLNAMRRLFGVHKDGEKSAAEQNYDAIWGIGAPTGGADGGGRPSPGRSAGRSLASVVTRYMTAQGIDGGTAQGIGAGVFGEGGNLGYSDNGAFGIGQWRGPRLKRLLKQFGPHPDLKAQLQFLAWEIKGGDPGGAAVLAQKDKFGALWAYAHNLMRPDLPGHGLKNATADYRRGSALYGPRAGAGGGSTVNINSMTIVTQAKDAHGVARDIHGAIKRRASATPANSGLD
jgi:hypothetical protein